MSKLSDTLIDAARVVAPTIASFLPGGPLVGAAFTALSNAVLGKPDGKPEEITAAVATMSPDQIAAVREKDQVFAEKMKELDLDADKLVYADRDSARKREADTHDSITPRALATFVTLGFFGVLFYLLVYGKPTAGGDALLVMLGSLGTAWTAIIAYYFGSSAGSDRKTALLANSVPAK